MGDEGISLSKIKVLRIIARLNIGGPAINTIILSRYMERLGYETLLAAGQVGPDEGDMSYMAEAEGVKPVILAKLGRRLKPLNDLFALFTILRSIFNFRPHIVHTHTAKAGAVGRAAASVYNGVQSFKFKVQSWVHRLSRGSFNNTQDSIINDRCKVVHTFHGHVLEGYFSKLKSSLFQLIEKILAKFTDVIVVVSERQKDELCTRFGIGRPEQYRVIPLGLDFGLIENTSESKGKLRAELGLKENGHILVGIVGRLTPIKNHRLFLESVSLLLRKKKNKGTLFLIVGDGELHEELKEGSKGLGLEERVIFTGWIRELESLYADLDVLALTSNNEGTPVAAIEALAAGVPVIATDVGGVRELISEMGTRPPERGNLCHGGMVEVGEGEFEVCERGVLVKKGDVEGFAKGLNYLLENPKVRKEIGARGRKYALAHHTIDKLVSNMDMLYRSLLFADDK
jgi:glycosyltransferase involved in cell wall biosynthesis